MEKTVFETAKAFRALNEMAMKDQVAIFGSDYLCDFPFYDLMQGRVTDYVIYNRSIKGLTVKDAAADAAGAPLARHRKVTVCALVQLPLGAKVTALVPLVMPFSTAHK